MTIIALVFVGMFYGGMRCPRPQGSPNCHGGLAREFWWCGCLLAQLKVAQKIGASPFLALTVTAGVIVSIAMNDFGWLGSEHNPQKLVRLTGGGMVMQMLCS